MANTREIDVKSVGSFGDLDRQVDIPVRVLIDGNVRKMAYHTKENEAGGQIKRTFIERGDDSDCFSQLRVRDEQIDFSEGRIVISSPYEEETYRKKEGHPEDYDLVFSTFENIAVEAGL